MFLLVPAHPGFPGQIPQSRKTVVCVCLSPCPFAVFSCSEHPTDIHLEDLWECCKLPSCLGPRCIEPGCQMLGCILSEQNHSWLAIFFTGKNCCMLVRMQPFISPSGSTTVTSPNRGLCSTKICSDWMQYVALWCSMAPCGTA